MKYYFKSEFEITEEFKDVNGDLIDIRNIDLILLYITDGSHVYEVSKKGNVFKNCYLNDNILHVVFQNHKLRAGKLKREITLFFDNVNFESKIQRVSIKQLTDIELVNIGGEQGSVDLSTSMPVVSGEGGFLAITKNALVDGDEVLGYDSEDNGKPIRTKWLLVKAFLKTYFDSIYSKFSGSYNDLSGKPSLDISEIPDASNKRTEWDGKQDKLTAGTNISIEDNTISAKDTTYKDSDFDIKDLADSTNLRSTWSSKQNALVADTDYLTPTTAGTTYEPKKQATDLYVTENEKSTWNNKKNKASKIAVSNGNTYTLADNTE